MSDKIEVPTPDEIEQKRQEAGLTQGELADKAGISQPAYSKIKSGNNDPKLSTVATLAHVINQEL